MAFLPQEIIFQGILPKLPVKSICRFKCISKSFLALFTDPLFIKTHLSQTQREKLLVLSDLYLIDLETSSSSTDEKLAATRLDFSKGSVEVIGSCNGLFCLYVPESRVFYFYNPSTRECSIEVPNYMNEYLQLILLQSSPWFKWNDDYPTAGDGFGYAPSIDDYKMVILSGWKYVTHVFSLRNNSWKTIDQYEENLLGSGTPLNGALHWLAFSPTYSPDDRYSIVSFDLVEEKFISFSPLPNYFQSCTNILDVVDDCLCMLVTKGKLNYEIWKNENNVYEIWVMKEYGVEDSWTRILISKEHLQKPIYQSNYLSLKLCLNRGMAFFLKDGDGNPILCYQEIDGPWKEVMVDGLPAPNYVLVFTESLVSPNWYISKDTNDSLLVSYVLTN